MPRLIIFKAVIEHMYTLKPTILLAVLIMVSLVPFAAAQTVTLEIGSQSTEINYQVTDMTVNGVKAVDDGLLFSVSAPEQQGVLVVVLDRDIIDSTMDGADVNYIVTSDQYPIFDFTESDTTDTSRTLRIPVPVGTDEIEIIGTMITNEILDLDVGETDATDATGTENDVVEITDIDDAIVMTENDVIEMTETSDVIDTDTKVTMTDTQTITCGNGTTLGVDGITCVLDSKPVIPFRDLVFGIIAGFIVSFVVIIILYPISRASRS